MEVNNHSLLAKLRWKLTINSPSLWIDVRKGKYLKEGIPFLKASPNPTSSWLWKGLLKKNRVVILYIHACNREENSDFSGH